MNTQTVQKLKQNMRILSFSKRGLCKKCWVFCKIQQMLQKIFPIILWYLAYFQNVFWMLYQHVPKKTLRKVELLTENSQKTAFHGKTRLASFKRVFFFFFILKELNSQDHYRETKKISILFFI